MRRCRIAVSVLLLGPLCRRPLRVSDLHNCFGLSPTSGGLATPTVALVAGSWDLGSDCRHLPFYLSFARACRLRLSVLVGQSKSDSIVSGGLRGLAPLRPAGPISLSQSSSASLSDDDIIALSLSSPSSYSPLSLAPEAAPVCPSTAASAGSRSMTMMTCWLRHHDPNGGAPCPTSRRAIMRQWPTPRRARRAAGKGKGNERPRHHHHSGEMAARAGEPPAKRTTTARRGIDNVNY